MAGRSAQGRNMPAGAALLGAGVAAATSVALSRGGRLDGPSLLPWGGPLAESLVGASLGAAIGLAPATQRSGRPEPQ